MLMYGRGYVADILSKEKVIIYNISSLREGFKRLYYLTPPNNIGKLSSRDFDINFANYIMNYDPAFVEFFQIIYNLYIGNDVLLLMDDADWSENLIESLLKLIQQRYGYNAISITSEEDYIYAKNSDISSKFASGYGLLSLDQDKERFTYLVDSGSVNVSLPYELEGYVIANDA